MSASLKKIKKILPAFSPAQVKATVLQALTSDEESREGLFVTLKGKGLDKEIANSFLSVVKEEGSKVKLDAGDLVYLREHLSLLGSESSAQFFDELLNLLGDNEQGTRRNAAFLLEYFLGTVHILSYAKLRTTVKERLPGVVKQMWKASDCGMAAFVAKQLLYVLLLEKSYLDVEDVEELWVDMFSKSMKSCPLMSLLTVLLSGSSATHWTTAALCSISAESFDSDVENDPVLSSSYQFASLVLEHKDYLVGELNFVTFQRMLSWTLKNSTENDKLSEVFSSFVDCRGLLSSQDTVARLLVSASFAVVLEELESAGKFQNKAEVTAWYKSLISLMEEGTELAGPLERFLVKFIDHIAASGGKLAKVKCPDAVISVFTALEALPFPRLKDDTIALFKTLFLVTGTVFSSKTAVVSSCVTILASLIGQKKGLPLRSEVTDWLDVLYGNWLPSIAKDCNEKVGESLVTVLATGLRSLPKELDSEQRYLTSAGQPSDMAADFILRIAAFCESTPWRKFDSMSSSEKDRFIFEVKSNALDKALSSVDPSSPDFLQGFIFNFFKNMTKEERINILPLFMTSKQRKKLSKNAVKIISGSKGIREQSIVTKALHFFISNSHNCEPDDPGHFSNLLNWSCLLGLHSIGAEPIDVILERVTSEQALSLLKDIPAALENGEEIVSLVAVTEKLVKRVAPGAGEQLLDVLIAFSELSMMPSALLGLCAEFIRISATGPFERPIVALSFTIASTFNEINFDSSAMFAMESLLHSCLRYAHPSVTNDQCATYTHLVTKHFRGVQFFAQHKKAPQDEIERMVYGCARIAHQISQHATYFSRIICSVISETVLGYQHIELAMCKLHSINDRHSSALLATTLPPAEKRQYGRVFPEIRKSLKRIV